MRIIKAFFTALLLFLVSVAGFRIYVDDAITSDKNDIDYYLNQKKFLSTSALEKNLTKNTALVLGSSELSRLYDSPYHPKQMVNALDMSFMLIGEGYFQSLNHAIRMGAIGSDMKNKKVNLILSPQWFTKAGTDPVSFTSRFSEDNFVDFLKNTNIDKKTKMKIIKRTNELLMPSPKIRERVMKYENAYISTKSSITDSVYTGIFSSFISLKTDVAFLSDYLASDIYHKSEPPVPKFTGIDESRLIHEADRIGETTVTNPFNMDNVDFSSHYENRVERKKNSQQNDSYSVSPEYKDLQLFLDVCKQNRVKVNIIMIPVNGAWYDHIGFKKEIREEFYNKIRGIANQNKVTLSDLSEHEYTKYFFMDATHYGWKGWVYVNESVIDFEKQ